MPSIIADGPIKTTPRMSRALFIDVLVTNRSPWAERGGELYDLIVRNDHDPGFWLAVAGREHGFGSNRDSVLWRNDTNSWTNARSVRAPLHMLSGPATVIHDEKRRGPYVRYASVEDSLIDGMYRVDDPSYVYQQRNATSIAEVIAIWTESDADSYIAYVVARLNEWISAGKPVPITWAYRYSR